MSRLAGIFKKDRSTIVVIIALALGFRLLLLAFYPITPHGSNAILAYLPFANALIEGKSIAEASQYFVTWVPPFYPTFVGISFAILGENLVILKLIQIILDSCTAVLIFYISKRLFCRNTAVISSLLYCMYPLSAISTISVDSEPLFTFILALFVLLAIHAFRSNRGFIYFIAGSCLGLATLTRTTTQAFPVLFILIAIYINKKISKALVKRCSLFCFGFLLIIAPWSIRNFVVLDEFIPVALGGSTVLHGSSEEFFLVDRRDREIERYLEQLESKGIYKPNKEEVKESVMDKFMVRAGLERHKMRFENDPLNFISFFLKKFTRLWYSTESGNNQGKIVLINLLIYPLFFIGLILSIIKIDNRIHFIIYGLVFYFILLHLVTVPLFRYLLPVIPYIIIFVGYGALSLWNFVLKKERLLERTPAHDLLEEKS